MHWSLPSQVDRFLSTLSHLRQSSPVHPLLYILSGGNDIWIATSLNRLIISQFIPLSSQIFLPVQQEKQRQLVSRRADCTYFIVVRKPSTLSPHAI